MVNEYLIKLAALLLILSPSSYAKTTNKTFVQRASEVNKKLIGLVDKDWIDVVDTNLKKVPTPEDSPVLKSAYDDGSFFETAADDLRNLKKIYQTVRQGHWDSASSLLSNLKQKPVDQITEPGAAYKIDKGVWDLYAKGISQMDPYLKLLEREIDRLSNELNVRFLKFRDDLAKATSV